MDVLKWQGEGEAVMAWFFFFHFALLGHWEELG